MASHGASGVGADWSDVAGALDASQSQATASDGPTGRIWCVSDVHTDHADNMRWCEGLAHGRRFENDALILAGDVTASNELLERTLRTLVGAFAVVYYTPGNHDLWVKGRGAGNRPGQPPALDSIARAQEVFALCASLGVRTTPSYACGAIIAPILAWYHASFDTEPDVTGWEGIPSHKIVMNDFHLCQWPAGLSTEDDSIARRFDAMNDARGVELTTTVAALREAHPDAPLISFSHFVPRLELQPEKRYLYFPGLAKACGSTFLQERVAQLGPAMHVFGHTHFGWDATLDGVRYIQAPLSYPDERKGRLGTVASGETFPHGEPPTPLLIFDAQGLAPNGGWPGRYDAGWSNFYSRYPRRPDLNHILPPYVAEAYTPVKGEGGVVGEAGWFGDARDPNGELLGMPLPAWALGPASAVEIEKRAGKGADPALRKKVA